MDITGARNIREIMDSRHAMQGHKDTRGHHAVTPKTAWKLNRIWTLQTTGTT